MSPAGDTVLAAPRVGTHGQEVLVTGQNKMSSSEESPSMFRQPSEFLRSLVTDHLLIIIMIERSFTITEKASTDAIIIRDWPQRHFSQPILV